MSAKEQVSGQKRERSKADKADKVDQVGEAKTEKKMRLADVDSSTSSSSSSSTSSTDKKVVAAVAKKRIDSVPTATYKRINKHLRKVDGITIHDDDKEPDYLAPIGDDLERSDCVDGKWSPAVSSQGLSLLEHFLCVSYPLKENLKLLNEDLKKDKKTSITAEYAIYRAILEEATQLLLHSESSLVSTFIGFIQWNNKSGEIQDRDDFPDYLFFMDVIAHGYDRLPLDLVKRILTSMVHQDTTKCDLDEFSEALAMTFEDSLYDFCKDTGRWSVDDFKKHEERQSKMKQLYHEIATVISDEAEEMGVGDDEGEGDDDDDEEEEEGEGDDDEEGEGEESGSGSESGEEEPEVKPSKSKSKSAKSVK